MDKSQALANEKQRNRASKLSSSEYLSIMIFYHFNQFKHFKVYYQHLVLNKNDLKILAVRGHSSIDWFYGFKLHTIINEKSEIVAIKITKVM
jgi:hypothetical protein